MKWKWLEQLRNFINEIEFTSLHCRTFALTFSPPAVIVIALVYFTLCPERTQSFTLCVVKSPTFAPFFANKRCPPDRKINFI